MLHSLDFPVSCPLFKGLPCATDKLCFDTCSGVQRPWPGQASWTGEACSDANYSAWQGVVCTGGRVTSINMTAAGACGTLDAFGRLTALKGLWLNDNMLYGKLQA